MQIKKILWRKNKDFTAIFECEHCGFQMKEGGVVSAQYIKKTLPSMVCESCGKMRSI